MRRPAPSENPYQYNKSYIEEENTRREDQLAEKVKALKSLTIEIGDEVKLGNKLIRGMDDDFDKSSGFLSSTMKRLGLISRSGSAWHLCYLLLFCVGVFIFTWLFLKFR